MTPLITMLEQADCGSRELDGMIATTLGLPHGPWERVYIESRSIEHGPEQALHFTTSLDAAMTLVPDSHTVYMTRPNLQATNYSAGTCYACVAPPGLGGPQYARKRSHLTAFHKSLPLALCIAALKATREG